MIFQYIFFADSQVDHPVNPKNLLLCFLKHSNSSIFFFFFLGPTIKSLKEKKQGVFKGSSLIVKMGATALMEQTNGVDAQFGTPHNMCPKIQYNNCTGYLSTTVIHVQPAFHSSLCFSYSPKASLCIIVIFCRCNMWMWCKIAIIVEDLSKTDYCPWRCVISLICPLVILA